jgi:gamma-glutamyltranspeptidase
MLVFTIAADGWLGEFLMATGSLGGGTMPQYVLKTLIGVLDWGLDAPRASNPIGFAAGNGRRRPSAARIPISTRATTPSTIRSSPA